MLQSLSAPVTRRLVSDLPRNGRPLISYLVKLIIYLVLHSL